MNNLKIKKSILLVFSTIIYFNTFYNYSQNINEKCINNKLIEYLISVNQLKNINDSKNELTKYIYSHEIIDRTLLGSKMNAIYIFGANTSHTPTYFLLKKNNNFKILSGFNELRVFEEVIHFLKEQNFKDNRNLKYLKAVLEIIENNSYAMYFDDSLIKTSWFNCCDNDTNRW